MNIFKRAAYRLAILLVLIFGLVVALAVVPLDILFGLALLVWESTKIAWGDLRDSVTFHVDELHKVLVAFADAFRRGAP